MTISAQQSQVAAKFILKADYDIYQDANNQTGRCYGPTFKEGVPIHIDLSNITVNLEPITAPPTEQPAKGTWFYYYKNATFWGTFISKNINKIDPNTGILSQDLTYYVADDDRLLIVQYENADNPFAATKTLIKERIEIVPADEVDESKCLMYPPEDFALCEQIPSDNTDQIERCRECFAGGGIWTAVGCIPSEPESVIAVIIEIGLTLGGAIVLIMIIAGAFMLSTSQGDPKKTQDAKELITSAIIGLLFIIFSVTILQFIGVSVIRIPGFGE